jgi:hypothetical protein
MKRELSQITPNQDTKQGNASLFHKQLQFLDSNVGNGIIIFVTPTAG